MFLLVFTNFILMLIRHQIIALLAVIQIRVALDLGQFYRVKVIVYGEKREYVPSYLGSYT